MALIVGSLAFICICLEIISRIHYDIPIFSPKNILSVKGLGDLDRKNAVYHPKLGWTPRQGSAGNETILSNGIRSNGNTKSFTGDKPVILAVGDSFTYGDQVNDNETWPAYLESLSGFKVINAGVYGYGLDQVVLRAKNLVEIVEPEIIIVGVYTHDLIRCRHSVRGYAPKPYFSIIDGSLVLQNMPVPAAGDVELNMDYFKKTFGHSALVHLIMSRLFWDYWVDKTGTVKVDDGQGVDVSCLLIKDLAFFAGDTPLIVMIQYGKKLLRWGDIDLFLNCLKDIGIDSLDLHQALESVFATNPDRFDSYYIGHMSAQGNHFVAAQLAEFLRSGRNSGDAKLNMNN